MSDTPRTDAAVEMVRTASVFKDNFCERVSAPEEMVPASLARELERALGEASRACQAWAEGRRPDAIDREFDRLVEGLNPPLPALPSQEKPHG